MNSRREKYHWSEVEDAIERVRMGIPRPGDEEILRESGVVDDDNNNQDNDDDYSNFSENSYEVDYEEEYFTDTESEPEGDDDENLSDTGSNTTNDDDEGDDDNRYMHWKNGVAKLINHFDNRFKALAARQTDYMNEKAKTVAKLFIEQNFSEVYKTLSFNEMCRFVCGYPPLFNIRFTSLLKARQLFRLALSNKTLNGFHGFASFSRTSKGVEIKQYNYVRNKESLYGYHNLSSCPDKPVIVHNHRLIDSFVVPCENVPSSVFSKRFYERRRFNTTTLTEKQLFNGEQRKLRIKKEQNRFQIQFKPTYGPSVLFTICDSYTVDSILCLVRSRINRPLQGFTFCGRVYGSETTAKEMKLTKDCVIVEFVAGRGGKPEPPRENTMTLRVKCNGFKTILMTAHVFGPVFEDTERWAESLPYTIDHLRFCERSIDTNANWGDYGVRDGDVIRVVRDDSQSYMELSNCEDHLSPPPVCVMLRTVEGNTGLFNTHLGMTMSVLFAAMSFRLDRPLGIITCEGRRVLPDLEVAYYAGRNINNCGHGILITMSEQWYLPGGMEAGDRGARHDANGDRVADPNHVRPHNPPGPNNARNRARRQRNRRPNNQNNNNNNNNPPPGGGGGNPPFPPQPPGGQNADFANVEKYEEHRHFTNVASNSSNMSGALHLSNVAARSMSEIVSNSIVDHNSVSAINSQSWAAHRHDSTIQCQTHAPTLHIHQASILPGVQEKVVDPYVDRVNAQVFEKPNPYYTCYGRLLEYVNSWVDFTPRLFGCAPLNAHPVVEEMASAPGWVTKNGYTKIVDVEISENLLNKLKHHKRGRNATEANSSSLMTLAHEFQEVKNMDPVLIDNTVALAVQYHDYKKHVDELRNPKFKPCTKPQFFGQSPYFYLANLSMAFISMILMCTFIKIAMSIRILMIMAYLVLQIVSLCLSNK